MIFIGLLLPCISAIGDQNTINNAEKDSMDSIVSFPSSGTQSCNGIYVIDSTVKEAVIMSSARSDDEVYSNQKFCAWYITADQGKVIQLRFDYFFTECFWDTVTIFDGPDYTHSIIGKLCGNRDDKYGYSDVIVSTGQHLTIFFQTDSDIGARGFRALSRQIDPISRNFTLFTPRMHHSSAFDPKLDVIYHTFGLSNGGVPLDDMILYYPANDSFVKRSGWTNSPTPRYSHFSWILDSKLIICGGIPWITVNAFTDDLNDVWSYDPGIIL